MLTPEYSWINISLKPEILLQGTWGYFSLISLGMLLTASPIISSLLITAS